MAQTEPVDKETSLVALLWVYVIALAAGTWVAVDFVDWHPLGQLLLADLTATAVVSSSDRLEMRPQAIAGTSSLLYISKPRFGFDQMVVLDLSGGEPTVLKQQAIVLV